MAIADEIKRWTKDRFSQDENITTTPTKALRSVEENFSEFSSTERRRNIEHLKAYADLYYQGRHNTDVPKELRDSLQQLDKRAERLNAVDTAREVVAKFGGPPSPRTVEESLQRSLQERNREHVPERLVAKANERGKDVLEVAKSEMSGKSADRVIGSNELASVAAVALKSAEPKIEREWAQALRKGESETAVSARFEANLEGLNALRKDLLQRHPDWEQKLPPAVNIQEVSHRIAERIREQKIEQEISR